MTVRRLTTPADGDVSCECVRESVSARLDGERATLPGPVAEAHLGHCTACRDFRDGATALVRQVGVRPARPVPAAVRAGLRGLVVPPVASTPQRLIDGLRDRSPGVWRRATRWVAVTAPVATLSVALPLGAWSQPRIMPSHPATPCTAALSRHGGALRRS